MASSVARDLRNIDRMPYGTARTAAAEMIVRKIEADGPRQHLAEALLGLVEAYTFANEGAKSFVVFARLLRLWDESPEVFDAGDRRNLFWEFKWVAGDLSDYPQITLEQAQSFLADMERRFSVAGHGTSSVAMSRFRWAWHAGQASADADRLAWVTGMRDEFEDCRACTIGQQVDYFTEVGRWDEAVALGITLDSTCNLEPTRTHHATALSALLAGDPELALKSHKLSLATLDTSDSDFAPARGQGFELLARGGQLELALMQLRNEYPELLTAASTPLFRMRFLMSVLAGLSANLDRSEQPTGLRPQGAGSGPWGTVGALHAWVRGQLDTLVAQFDARNGTTYYADLARRALTATRAERPLEMESIHVPGDLGGTESAASVGADLGPKQGAGASAAESAQASQRESAESAIDAEGQSTATSVLGRAEFLASQRNYPAASRSYAEAGAAFQSEGWIERSGFAFAEAAQCASLAGDETAAHDLFGTAVSRLRTGGAEVDGIVQVLMAWAPIAARVGDPAGFLAVCSAQLAELVEFDATDLSEELAERKRAEWVHQRASLRDSLARVVASAQTEQRPGGLDLARACAEATTAGEEFAGLGLISDAAHAFWLAGKIQRDEGLTTDAVWSLESAFEGFTVARVRDDRAQVAGELIELLRGSGQTERADEVAAELLR